LLARSLPFPKRIVLFAAAVLVVASVGFCIQVWLRARSAVADGVRSAASSGQEQVSVTPLQPSASRFERVLVAPEFESAAEFSGDVFVCGSSALFEYAGRELKKTWYAGRELPAAPLRSLVVRKGIGSPELWIATDGAGVLIYDGSSLRQLLPEKPALRKISAMLPLRNGSVLIGTPTAGLWVSDGKTLRVFHPELAHAHVTALAGDEDQFWMGTQADGAWEWRGGEALHLTAGLPDRQVLSLASVGDQAWVGTGLGVAEFRGERYFRRLAEGTFAQALAVQAGKLYIGTIDQGLFALPLSVQNPRPLSATLGWESGPVVSFAKLGGNLVAVERGHLVDAEQRKPLIMPPQPSLASNHVTAIQEDSRKRLWIGYFDRGIDVMSASSEAQQHFEDDTLFCINRIKENPQDNSILTATANGLAVFDAGAKLRQVLTRENGLITSNVTDMLFPGEADGGLSMVAATPAGLSFFERGSVSSVYAFQGLVNNHVYTLATLNGTLYAGTLGGLSTLRQGLVQASYNTGNSQLKQNWITASAVFENHLYLGTYGSGVIRFEEGHAIQTFGEFAGRRVEINLNALAVTERALYAGTARQGLAVLRKGEERWHLVSAGLPSVNVTALAARGGRLYVGTDNGLVQIEENDLLP
jgi:ligand-binding sensor domain-containing protein